MSCSEKWRTDLGASRWHYFIEGQNDAQSALDDLREREFAKSWSDYDPSITSLSELVNSGALEEEGAHSIIDVDRVIESDDPEYDEDGTVRLLLPQEVVEYFGTEKPTRETVESVYSTARRRLPPLLRGSGCCTAIYEQGAPCGFAFWGMTGD
ncbi:hypothetical protein D1J63_31160 [Streptomyces sp. KPB2]|uniref:hypothetical protein n=1 Tax=unclassified Streptomyces TaxID=2593676 RepID=UPI000F6D1245|nr:MULTISPECIES: hypothetical protein [unclassified Streptomyces]AZM78909.1 hypothetical protein D1J63_31160 [Streptomyces sp. KPB2]MDU0252717.1 hypothetical protein [Streptomyces sp. PU10]